MNKEYPSSWPIKHLLGKNMFHHSLFFLFLFEKKCVGLKKAQTNYSCVAFSLTWREYYEILYISVIIKEVSLNVMNSTESDWFIF